MGGGVFLNINVVVVAVVALSVLGRILGECSTIHSPPALLFVFVCLKWRLARPHYLKCLFQDQSTVAQRAEITVTKCSLSVYVFPKGGRGCKASPPVRNLRAVT